MQTVGTEQPEITPRQDVEEIRSEVRPAVWKKETGEERNRRGKRR